MQLYATKCKDQHKLQLQFTVGGVRRMNQVNARRARLALGWVTVFGRVYRLGMQPAN